jgi:hypothetical protein
MSFSLKPAKTPRAHWYDAVSALIISAVFFGILAFVAPHEYAFVQSAAHAQGEVIRQTSGKHHVDVRFTAANGEVVTYPQNGFVSYEAGDKVTVYYDAGDPQRRPSTDGIGALWGYTITVCLFAFGFLGVALGLIFLPDYFDGPFSRSHAKQQERARKRQQSA